MEEFVKGGAFLIESISPQEIFTPEDFNEEQQLIAKAATEFVVGEVLSVADDIEEKKEGLLSSLLKKAGELGFLSADIPEEYGGQDLDKVSSLLLWEKTGLGGGSFHGFFCGPNGNWFSSHCLLWQQRPEETISTETGHRRDHWCLCPD